MSQINWGTGCWVTTIYLVHDSRVLLSWNKNMQTWIPVGGHVDLGETPEEAIIREVAEETGLEFEFLKSAETLQKGDVKEIYPHHIQIEKVPHHGKHINVVFVGKCSEVTAAVATDEGEKLHWFSKEELVKRKSEFLESVWMMATEALEKN
jgi:8-oxo-dGTP pyrophosphatase MutT (NUDIX family)